MMTKSAKAIYGLALIAALLTQFSVLGSEPNAPDDVIIISNDSSHLPYDRADPPIPDWARCMKGNLHKSLPSAETLDGACSIWSNLTCCTANISEKLQSDPTWHNFDWNHCEQQQQAMSSTCRDWFISDLCFYECSPNVGPWIVPDSRKWRDESYKFAPLCQSECDSWFGACKDDYTCSDNWFKGFNFSTGVGQCVNKTCDTIGRVFGNAKNFCEKVWNDSFQVVSDTERCLKLRFDASSPNPNDAVTAFYYKSGQSSQHAPFLVTIAALLLSGFAQLRLI